MSLGSTRQEAMVAAFEREARAARRVGTAFVGLGLAMLAFSLLFGTLLSEGGAYGLSASVALAAGGLGFLGPSVMAQKRYRHRSTNVQFGAVAPEQPKSRDGGADIGRMTGRIRGISIAPRRLLIFLAVAGIDTVYGISILVTLDETTLQQAPHLLLVGVGFLSVGILVLSASLTYERLRLLRGLVVASA